MLELVDQRRVQSIDAPAWLEDGVTPLDVVADLLAGVTSEWEVTQEVDPVGDISIVVMPTRDGPAKPSFLLYGKAGRVQVGTIRDDNWESDQAFATTAEAVAAIVLAVAAAP